MFVKEATTLKEIVLILERRVKKEMVLHIVFTHIVQMVDRIHDHMCYYWSKVIHLLLQTDA